MHDSGSRTETSSRRSAIYTIDLCVASGRHRQATVESLGRWEPAKVRVLIPIGVDDRERAALGESEHLDIPTRVVPIATLALLRNIRESLDELRGEPARGVAPGIMPSEVLVTVCRAVIDRVDVEIACECAIGPKDV